MKAKLKNDSGSVIVEASLVFPIMFIVIIFLIYVGNAYLQKCRVMAIIENNVREAAAEFADPLLEAARNFAKNEDENKSFEVDSSVDLKPYRYIGGIFGGGKVEDVLANEINKEIGALDTGIFNNMKPTFSLKKIDFKGYFVYSSVTATVEYRVKMPIRLLGQDERMDIVYSDTTTIPINDSPEMIRNIDFVEDIIEKKTDTDFETAISNAVNKVKELFKKDK